MTTLSSTLTDLSPFLLFGTACAFVAATAWNDAVQAGLAQWYPDPTSGASFKAKMVYAFIVTLIIIALVWFAQWLATHLYSKGK